ncbi:fetal and adult testis-expressed transcript protein [Dromiciops gliroides]|uniref:fetal and adult testis-expressed transcript protein n=1 Tax=Dromiciops gliroides TaxID=33562 RepID=UPI001CC64AE8|nr:fetal and adult testis-expressed transcript protein [Dromiciops gliroides]
MCKVTSCDLNHGGPDNSGPSPVPDSLRQIFCHQSGPIDWYGPGGPLEARDEMQREPSEPSILHSGDRNFPEVFNQSLQMYPKVSGGAGNEEARGVPDSLPLSLYMSIPDPVLLGDPSDEPRPLWSTQLRRNSAYTSSILVPASYLSTVNSPLSVLLSSIRPRRLLFPATALLKDQACSEDNSMAAEVAMDLEEGSREGGLAVEGALEDMSGLEISAMKKQLHKISERLQALEAQCTGWRHKELLLYSALISACVINTWLWMRR